LALLYGFIGPLASRSINPLNSLATSSLGFTFSHSLIFGGCILDVFSVNAIENKTSPFNYRQTLDKCSGFFKYTVQ